MNALIEHPEFPGLDLRSWPLVRHRGSELFDTGSIETFHEGMRGLLALDRRFCLLIDLSDARRLELTEIRLMVSFAQSHGAQLRKLAVALALVVPSPMVRGALKVAFTLRPPEHAYRIFRDETGVDDFFGPYLARLGAPLNFTS